MGLFQELFTWWNGQTLGTRVFTSRHGALVGEDDLGNKYYHTKDGKRRWVIYAGEAEASTVPPDWHGWLHHTFEEPPTKAPLPRKSWEKGHLPNRTGSDDAYRPKGSLYGAGERQRSGGDYEAWSPE
ncbi:MAG: NADH:ubiquinone oxidoreductase subunit NDUFA12 [Pseudomonadota bacterium]